MASAKHDVDNLISVIQFFRHGQRTPGIISPKHPYQQEAYWPSGPSELTNAGRLQLYDLGQFTRERYSTFLPTLYLKKDFSIYSTSQDTTLTSAQLFAAGLYPPIEAEVWKPDLKWRPIPIRESDPYLLNIAPFDHPHAGYRRLYDIVLREYQAEYLLKYEKLHDYIGQHLGETVDNVLPLAMLFDNTWCAASFGLPLPEWLKEVYPEPLTGIVHAGLKRYYATEEMSRICGGPIMYEILQHFKESAANPSKHPKLLAYACHDHNLLGIYETLGFREYEWPEVASSIYFELRRGKNGPYLNVYAKPREDKKEVIPLSIPGASFDCPLEDYEKVLGNILVSKEQIRKESDQLEFEGGIGSYKTLMDEFREKIAKGAFLLDPKAKVLKIT